MAHPLVVNCKKADYDVYVGRPSKWGNPYRIGRDGNRSQVVRKYRRRVERDPQFAAEIRRELHGKTLGCHCSPLACHADVLAEIANPAHAISGKLLAVDTEATGLMPWHGDQPYLIGFYNEAGDTLAYEWPVDPWTRIVVPDPDELEEAAAILEDPTIDKIFHHAKFDVRMLEQGLDVHTVGRIHETMFMAHVVNTQEPSFGLKQLSGKYLDYPTEDKDLLHKMTVRLRRVAKKLGWSITQGNKENVPPDYWVARALEELGLLPDGEDAGLTQEYCLGDCERTMTLFQFLTIAMADLDSDGFHTQETYRREMKLWPITYAMETRGIQVHLDTVEEAIVDQQALIEKHRDEVEDAAKGVEDFDIESPESLRELLYDKLSLPVLVRTDKKKLPAVNVDALAEHIANPVIASLFKYRAASKGLSTYFLNYRKYAVHDMLVKENGSYALHPDFQQMGPGTGRYACRHPNIQNVANALTTRSTEPIQARTPFGPRPGYTWYHWDYAGVEPRVFADVADEQTMLAALRAGQKPHAVTANRAWGGEGNYRAYKAAFHALEFDGSGTASNKVQDAWAGLGLGDWRKMTSKEMDGSIEEWLGWYAWDIVKAEESLGKKTCYARAKMVLFLKIFGGGASALAPLLQCDKAEAQEFLDDFDEGMPRIVEYMKETKEQARLDGYIMTRFSRRLSVNRDKAYRAVNYIVQGSAADLLKRAMVNVDRYLKESGLDVHLILSIHDELVAEVRKEHAKISFLRRAGEIMADHGGAFRIATPVEIERVTTRWNEKQPVRRLPGLIFAKGQAA